MDKKIVNEAIKYGFPVVDETAHRLLQPKLIDLKGVKHIHFNSDPQQILPTLQPNTTLKLSPDSANKADKYAIAVMTEDNKYIGWLPKGSEDIHRRLIKGKTVYCRLNKVYEFDEGGYGAEIVIAMYAMNPSIGSELKWLRSVEQNNSTYDNAATIPQPQTDGNESNSKAMGCLTALLLVIFWPAGLALMWAKKVFNQPVRIIISVIAVLALVSCISGSDEPASDVASQKFETTTTTTTTETTTETTTVATTQSATIEATTIVTTQATTTETTTVTTTTEDTTVAPVEHRTGASIIGVSNKNIEDLKPLYFDHVHGDVTGNWRYLSIAQSDVVPEEYALSVYNQYFDSDNNVMAVVNFTTRTTTRINCVGNFLSVDTYEYVSGEEHDANILFTGAKYSSSFVYIDNGDIESVE